ncbi:WD40 repeat-like protein [Gonapodya prolifera JEL478]|uniref:WD40 repeat-like protein n=1 Tax=Gonapodya prolifera (strain JEL478) TaxID=1344416 RepID=A0A139ATU5_GONPJ|nr:WD40 repeat-like protein [Gonapodya prolifera JEL478]|eukprot:KXS20166.1 WD40 repeat-like protein [Gonapodya prolifera JEL478]
MRTDFRFSNLCGVVYKQGNVIFTPDGNSIVSAVGNRVSVFDLVNNVSNTLPFENRKTISRIALSPNAALLISIDEDGKSIVFNVPNRTSLHHHSFKEPVRDVRFSPNGSIVLVTQGRLIQAWRTPGHHREFAPFVLHRTYAGHYDDVVRLSWRSCGTRFISASKDMTARIWTLNPEEGFMPAVLAGHRDVVVGAWFVEDKDTDKDSSQLSKDESDPSRIYTVSKDGAFFIWEEQLDVEADEDAETILPGQTKRPRVAMAPGQLQGQAPPGTRQNINTLRKYRWKIIARHYFNQNHAKVQTAEFHPKSGLLLVGFSSGVFGLWEVPDFSNIHTLSISQHQITAASISPGGEWLALGSSALGQLLVWEWQSETYVLKQQAHSGTIDCCSYSADGHHLATGALDGKVKVWSASNGFCFVTFHEHSAGVTKVEFARQGQVLWSSSLDGTVRGFDLLRYRNFRTLTTPTAVQFSSLAVDPSGDVVAAGGADVFEIYVWSVQTGRLLEVLPGHTGPIGALQFDPSGSGRLLSGSWDGTARVWEIFGRKAGQTESLGRLGGPSVVAVTWRPDGQEVALSTLDGMITFWDPEEANQVGSVEGRRDIAPGRLAGDHRTATNNSSGRCFTSLCYNTDGSCVLAGGRSRFVCIYECRSRVLLKRFQISYNLSLDGMRDFLNSKNMTDAGPLDLIDDAEGSSEEEADRYAKRLPGVQKGDLSRRKTQPEIRVMEVRFAPTGRSWAAATTEGLMIYSVDDDIAFDPFDLDIDVTPQTTKRVVAQGDWTRALVMSFRLGDRKLTQFVVEQTPTNDIELTVRQLPAKYQERMLKFLVEWLESTHLVEFALRWVTSFLRHHARSLKDSVVKDAAEDAEFLPAPPLVSRFLFRDSFTPAPPHEP